MSTRDVGFAIRGWYSFTTSRNFLSFLLNNTENINIINVSKMPLKLPDLPDPSDENQASEVAGSPVTFIAKLRQPTQRRAYGYRVVSYNTSRLYGSRGYTKLNGKMSILGLRIVFEVDPVDAWRRASYRVQESHAVPNPMVPFSQCR